MGVNFSSNISEKNYDNDDYMGSKTYTQNSILQEIQRGDTTEEEIEERLNYIIWNYFPIYKDYRTELEFHTLLKDAHKIKLDEIAAVKTTTSFGSMTLNTFIQVPKNTIIIVTDIKDRKKIQINDIAQYKTMVDTQNIAALTFVDYLIFIIKNNKDRNTLYSQIKHFKRVFFRLFYQDQDSNRGIDIYFENDLIPDAYYAPNKLQSMYDWKDIPKKMTDINTSHSRTMRYFAEQVKNQTGFDRPTLGRFLDKFEYANEFGDSHINILITYLPRHLDTFNWPIVPNPQPDCLFKDLFYEIGKLFVRNNVFDRYNSHEQFIEYVNEFSKDLAKIKYSNNSERLVPYSKVFFRKINFGWLVSPPALRRGPLLQPVICNLLYEDCLDLKEKSKRKDNLIGMHIPLRDDKYSLLDFGFGKPRNYYQDEHDESITRTFLGKMYYEEPDRQHEFVSICADIYNKTMFEVMNDVNEFCKIPIENRANIFDNWYDHFIQNIEQMGHHDRRKLIKYTEQMRYIYFAEELIYIPGRDLFDEPSLQTYVNSCFLVGIDLYDSNGTVKEEYGPYYSNLLKISQGFATCERFKATTTWQIFETHKNIIMSPLEYQALYYGLIKSNNIAVPYVDIMYQDFFLKYQSPQLQTNRISSTYNSVYTLDKLSSELHKESKIARQDAAMLLRKLFGNRTRNQIYNRETIELYRHVLYLFPEDDVVLFKNKYCICNYKLLSQYKHSLTKNFTEPLHLKLSSLNTFTDEYSFDKMTLDEIFLLLFRDLTKNFQENHKFNYKNLRTYSFDFLLFLEKKLLDNKNS